MAEKIRFVGFDILRAYAIFGMYIVNFNLVLGDPHHTSWLGQFLTLFSGNSSTIFVVLSGMGLTLRTEKSIYISPQEQFKRKIIVQKKAGFKGVKTTCTKTINTKSAKSVHFDTVKAVFG